MERMPREDRGRDLSDTTTKQGMPKIVSDHQKLGKDKEGSSPTALKESMALPNTPISDFQAPKL